MSRIAFFPFEIEGILHVFADSYRKISCTGYRTETALKIWKKQQKKK